jgi:hypothetical protein
MNLSSVFENVSADPSIFLFAFDASLFFPEELQVMPIVESGFSSPHSHAETRAHAPPASATSAAALPPPHPAAHAPLARSLDDSPMVSSHQQTDPALSEGDSWML